MVQVLLFVTTVAIPVEESLSGGRGSGPDDRGLARWGGGRKQEAVEMHFVQSLIYKCSGQECVADCVTKRKDKDSCPL
jgi:hypothetical protein